MKIFFTFFFSLILTFNLLAQNVPNFAWAKHLSGINRTDIRDVTVTSTIDFQGNIYNAARIIPQNYNLDGIQLQGVPSNSIYGYISKRDANRNIIWAVSTTKLLFDYANIITDNNGNIYLYAHYIPDLNQIPYIGNTPLMESSALSKCDFLVKMDKNGNLIWFKSLKSSSTVLSNLNRENLCSFLSFDETGNIQIVSPFVSDISISEDTLFSSNDLYLGAFYAKYSPDGSLLHFQKLAGSEYDQSKRLLEKYGKDALGNIYRISAGNLVYPNSQVVYKYNSNGNLLDSVVIPISSATGGFYQLRCFAVNSIGDVFIGGTYAKDLTLDGTVYPNYGGGTNNIDALLFKLSMSNHQVEWVKTISKMSKDQFDALDVDDLGNVYALGSNWGQIVQMRFQKYTKDGDLLWDLPVPSDTEYNPSSYNPTPISINQTQNGGNILVSGKFIGLVDFGQGYTFTSTGYDGFLAQYGICNTPNPIIDMPITTQLCGSDSITLTATLNNTNGNYFWSTPNGAVEIDNSNPHATLTIGTVGKYSLIFQEDEECYGKSQEIWITKVPLPDTSVTVQNNILTAVESTENTTYQWIDCQNNNTPISGATEQTFEPAENGEYAVIVTSENGCADTSSCHVINTLSVENTPMLAKQITLYPNPTSNEINIQTDLDVSEIYVLDLQGKQLQKTTSKEVDLSKLTSGIYLIKVKLQNNETWTSKVIKI